MDPDATRDALCDWASVILDPENAHLYEDNEPAQKMAELFQALDGWLARDGFLPAAWRRP